MSFVDKGHRSIVEAGGGIYKSSGGMWGFVFFNSPKTDTSLGLHPEDLTVERVRTEIANSDAAWAKQGNHGPTYCEDRENARKRENIVLKA